MLAMQTRLFPSRSAEEERNLSKWLYRMFDTFFLAFISFFSIFMPHYKYLRQFQLHTRISFAFPEPALLFA